jgi:hypothetical protein
MSHDNYKQLHVWIRDTGVGDRRGWYLRASVGGLQIKSAFATGKFYE